MISTLGSSGTSTRETSCEEAAGILLSLGVGDEGVPRLIQREAAEPCCGIVVENNTVETVPPISSSPTFLLLQLLLLSYYFSYFCRSCSSYF